MEPKQHAGLLDDTTLFIYFFFYTQVKLVGKERLVLDLSCRQRDGKYWVVTDRWQQFSQLALSEVRV